jgi:hypothetical protein
MEAIPLCLLLSKPHLFSLTKHRFRVIQFVTCKLHVSAALKVSWDSYCIFLCMVFILTCLELAYVQAETCGVLVRVTRWIKIHLFHVRPKKYGLFIHTLHYLQLPYTLSSKLLIPTGIVTKNSSYKVQFVIIFNHKTTFNINKSDDNNITGVDNQSGASLQLLANSKIS